MGINCMSSPKHKCYTHHIYLIDVNIIAGVVLGVYECLVHTHAVTLQDIQVLPEMEKNC